MALLSNSTAGTFISPFEEQQRLYEEMRRQQMAQMQYNSLASRFYEPRAVVQDDAQIAPAENPVLLLLGNEESA